MAYLADTNVVFRRILTSDPLHALVRSAVDHLLLQGEMIYICPQNLIEFHALATRPQEANGLGMTSADARVQARAIEATFPLLDDVPSIYSEWCALVDTYGVVGRQVFDARLAAVMMTHGVSHLLTLNGSHCRRFAGITVVDPHSVGAGAPPTT